MVTQLPITSWSTNQIIQSNETIVSGQDWKKSLVVIQVYSIFDIAKWQTLLKGHSIGRLAFISFNTWIQARLNLNLLQSMATTQILTFSNINAGINMGDY